ncbi:MAG: YqgE/AlgH family protein [Proteobacteria bacterium]|jgi:putative transcriptional regulator|nr:YqgE/AlgH family protein [Pseudomonadota bacterium]
MSGKDSTSGYLKGQLLAAMPTMQDPRFERSVIFLCAHNADGAMGLIVNRPLKELSFKELLDQLGIERGDSTNEIKVQYGGPVETGRGFVLHSPEYEQNGTISVDNRVGLTATIEILRDIARNRGPQHSLLALGYAGWGSGQLESEIQQNAWLNVPADDSLLFDHDNDTRWERAIAKLGVDLSLLSGEHGHA